MLKKQIFVKKTYFSNIAFIKKNKPLRSYDMLHKNHFDNFDYFLRAQITKMMVGTIN